MGVGDHELHATETTMAQAAQELAPERFGFAIASGHAEHLAAPVRVDADRDDHGDRDDAMIASHFDVRRVEPEIGPFVSVWPEPSGEARRGW